MSEQSSLVEQHELPEPQTADLRPQDWNLGSKSFIRHEHDLFLVKQLI